MTEEQCAKVPCVLDDRKGQTDKERHGTHREHSFCGAENKKGQTVKACPLHAIYYLSAALTSSAELEKIIVEK